MALLVFEDLQCPDCRKEHPRLLEAAATNDMPLVVHDFPMQRHKWAFPAAVLARYFDAISPALGAQVQADHDLGTRIGLEYVPLIFVLGRGDETPRWVEVTDTAMLDIAIGQMREDVRRARQP